MCLFTDSFRVEVELHYLHTCCFSIQRNFLFLESKTTSLILHRLHRFYQHYLLVAEITVPFNILHSACTSCCHIMAYSCSESRLSPGLVIYQCSIKPSLQAKKCLLFVKINNNNTLYYSVESSSKATQSSLIGDTVH